MGNRAIFLMLTWVAFFVGCIGYIQIGGETCAQPDGGTETTDGGGDCGAGGAPAGP
jgi:hypothetical protein